jgi:hypothetical protein
VTDEEARAELVAKIRALAKARKLASSGALFRSYDGDGDQRLDPDELTQLLADAAVGGMFRGVYVRRIFERLDLDADDGLSLPELNGVLRELDPPPPTSPPRPGDVRKVPIVVLAPEKPAESDGGALPWLIIGAVGWLATRGRR